MSPTARRLSIAATAIALATAAWAGRPVSTVASLDVDRFAGTWYELARLPNEFQRACVGDVSAQYRVTDDGKLAVTNRCRLGDGSIEQADGIARKQGDGEAKLEVSFLPEWIRWVPVGWGDYWVVALDADYRVAVVSDRKRENLWILARQPKIKSSAYRALVSELRERGFPVHRLQRTLHEPTLTTAPPDKRAQMVARGTPPQMTWGPQ